MNYKDGYAQAFSRPTIYIDDKNYICGIHTEVQKDTYRIGYAYSDGTITSWVNQYNENQISKSDSGWDSQMVEYQMFSNMIRHYTCYIMVMNLVRLALE